VVVILKAGEAGLKDLTSAETFGGAEGAAYALRINNDRVHCNSTGSHFVGSLGELSLFSG
jgi:hypothetical protein